MNGHRKRPVWAMETLAPMKNIENDRLVWMDLEMSGLNPNEHVILEIAAIVTDNDLNTVVEGPCVAIHHPENCLRTMETWSREHHAASGLLDRVYRSPYDMKKAEQVMLDFLRKYVEEGKSPLCGNSIWQDRRFLWRHMPSLDGYFHYRIIDVSSLKELVKRWYPSLPIFKKEKSHLALDDIRESIQELAYYRRHAFRV